MNYAPKLANIGIGCSGCVETVTEEIPSPEVNSFAPAVIHFQGAPDFEPERIAEPGPTGFPLKRFQPGAEAPPGDPYSPFIRIAGSDVVYNAPIIAAGEGPFDVTTHTNTSDRVLAVHIGKEGHAPSGQFESSWADMLFVKGFDAGQPIVYLSTDAGQPLTAVLERSTYVPALNQPRTTAAMTSLAPRASGCSALSTGRPEQTIRRRRVSSILRWTVTWVKTPPRKTRASSTLSAMAAICSTCSAISQPSNLLATPMHTARSGMRSSACGRKRRSRRAQHAPGRREHGSEPRDEAPGPLTGVNPATGEPEPYGSVGVDINCAVLGYTKEAPTKALEEESENGQFPPL